MDAIDEVLSGFGLRWCSTGFCAKCDTASSQAFSRLTIDARAQLVGLLSEMVDDWSPHSDSLLRTIRLLDEHEIACLVHRISKRDQLSHTGVWNIIRLSAGSQKVFLPNLGYHQHPPIHLHPELVPKLIQSGVRPGNEVQDAMSLLDYYSNLADKFEVLRSAVSAWRARHELLAKERHAAESRKRAEEERLAEIRRKRDSELAAATKGGPVGMLGAIAASKQATSCDFPMEWCRISDGNLLIVPVETLRRARASIPSTDRRCWRSFKHRIGTAIKKIERTEMLVQAADLSILDRLREAARSRWSLTFFPEEWASEALKVLNAISPELRAALLSKSSRIRRRCTWRTLRDSLPES